uniref:hypothetical protein n=1 Tax=Gelidibacter sp. TaxID=2018083 RepID=UPI00404B4B97
MQHYIHSGLIYCLEKMDDEKAKQMLEKLNSFETEEEFNEFYWMLKTKSLLESF